jgi:hypothetical protein
LSLVFSDVRDGAIVCLIANVMEQLSIDRAADLYHQARKVHHACPAFQTEVSNRYVSLSSIRSFVFTQEEYRNMYEWMAQWTTNDLENQYE